MRLKKRYLVTRQTTASLLQGDPDGMVKAELDEWGITMDTNA
tara:strand:- start:1593 stop:1718 length:126 start_codon:yes stop_codon:yes gene_type:complete